MASIIAAASRIKRELDQWINPELVDESCRKAKHRWRKRQLDPRSTVHLLMLQLLAQVALRGLRHVAQVSLSAQAICKARMRLPLKVMLSLVQRICGKLQGEQAAAPTLWNQLRVFLADGMSFLVPDRPKLAKQYGRASNQHGPSRSYPLPKLLALLDLSSGLISKVIALPHARQERTCLGRLLSYLNPGDLLLADRGFCGFAQLAMMIAAGVQGCMRIPQWQAVLGKGKGIRRRIRLLGRDDLLVRWTRPDHPAKWMSLRRWLQLPEALELRQITFRIKKPGSRDQWLRLITTLTDAGKYPAEQIVKLYTKRWQVEVYFRDMKRTLGMKQMRSCTVAGVRKEICAFVLLYNLIRHVMRQAADAMNVEPDRVSFIDTMRWLLWSPADMKLEKLVINPHRRRPPEPRVLKRGSHKYPLMRKARKTLRDQLLRELIIENLC
jgi:Transposase DDE domain